MEIEKDLELYYWQDLDKHFNDDDLVLAEYSATIVGLEILRSKHDEIEEEARKKAVVQLAIGTLSYSELRSS